MMQAVGADAFAYTGAFTNVVDTVAGIYVITCSIVTDINVIT